MSIKGPVRQVSQPVQWRGVRTMSSIEDYPRPGWQEAARVWHETHQMPPRTYPRWPLWEGLEAEYELREQNHPQRFPNPRQHHGHYPHGQRAQNGFFDVPRQVALDHGQWQYMPIRQALATPPILPHTFPRAAQPSVPLTVRAPAAPPQVAGYQIVGDGSTGLAAAGVSIGMMVVLIGAAVGVGYLYARYPEG